HRRTRLPHLRDPSDEVIHEYGRQREESVKKARHSFVPSIHATGFSCLGDASNTSWNGHGRWRRSSGSVLFCFPAERHTANARTGLSFIASLGCL
ncbi:hypothetical protein LZ30DRAFT_607124, partial [Colletotrichum cereale]